ncbi:uncharacterized protein with PIN domain [Neobacillus sp. B4I6]|uniref:hypothetical protein n=1 Tax=Neobacillus sp. B4I6 TaxID=3373925 RepID=UPI003D1FDCFB
MMDIKKYKQKLSDVFQINAITVDKDYFMLTHKPFKNIRMVSKRLFLDGENFHENQLYRTIMDNRDQHQFHVVKGDNGSGKSHLIRWIKEHYEHEAKNEAVIFISRMQSTLKGALQQIIHAEVIQNHETSHRLKKLIDANEHLDNKHLKNIILAHFMVAVREDDNTKEIKLRENQRKTLYDFLSSQETLEFLLRENGPIDRIQKKLAPGVHNEIMNDIEPHFLPEDFFITSSQALEFQKMDLSKKALRFISEIKESTDLEEQEEVEKYRENIAKYLNQFLDKVVQECLSLRGTDLKDIFILLRQELKKEGKGLTLFIEDITSFTGVDKDLVEVLISDHKEDQSLCRLISIVGITNGYYNTSLPENIKDRITNHIEIDYVVIQNENESAELAARYINAVYLDNEQIQEWKNNGYRMEEFPIATVFKNHKWANFKIDKELELSIFPFTKRALWNFYQQLDPKTPRNFLQTVLLQYIQKYTMDGPSGNFPPVIDKIIADFKIAPNWKVPGTDQLLSRKVPDDDLKGRYETLFRIWGNGTMDEQNIDGKMVVGGLEEDVFEVFGLKPVSGIQGSASTKTATTATTTTTTTSTGKNGQNSNGAVNVTTKRTDNPNGDGTKPDGQGNGGTTVTPPTPPVQPKRNRQLEEVIIEVEKWAKGEPLNNSWMMPELLEIIREYIAWDLEGIPAFIVKDFLTNNYVLIEGQPKTVKLEGLKFKRSNQLRYALEALVRYKYEGKGSWNIENANLAILSLHTWLETVRDDILAFLSKPFDYDGDNWLMDEYVTAAEFCTTSLMDGFTGDEKTAEDVYLQLLKDKQKETHHEHSKSWETIKNHLNFEHTDLYKRYFNLIQGSVRSVPKVLFYDSYEMINQIKGLMSRGFDLNLEEIPKGRMSSWYTSVNILVKLLSENKLNKAIEEERKHSLRFVDNFHDIIGERITKESIAKIIKEMKGLLDYLKEMNEPYPPSLFEVLYKNVINEQQIVEIFDELQSLADSNSLTEQLMILSNNPTFQVQPFYMVLENMSNLIEAKNKTYTKKISSSEQELSLLIGNPLEDLNQDIEQIREYLTELDERSVNNAVK